MSLDTIIDGNTAVSKDGLGLVTADAIKSLHNKIEQLVGLLDLANDSIVEVAGYTVVMSAVCHIA